MPTRIGLVGLNDRAQRLLLPGLVASPNATLTAVCSRDLTKAQTLASTLGPDVRAFNSLADLLTAGEIDAVFINTPASTHEALCLAAVHAGCAIICEKPLTAEPRAAARLLDAATRASVQTVVNFTYRSVPGFRATERWLHDHPLGTLRYARFELLQGHNYFPGFQHGSALLDSGSHLFDLMGALLEAAGAGEITAVRGSALSPEDPELPNAPDHGWTFTTQTECGLVATGSFTRGALGWRNGLRWTLAGDDGAIDVELDADRTLIRTVQHGDGAPQGVWRTLTLPRDIAADDSRFPAFHMNRLVLAVRGEHPFATFAHALHAHHIAAALRTSAHTGAWHTIP